MRRDQGCLVRALMMIEGKQNCSAVSVAFVGLWCAHEFAPLEASLTVSDVSCRALVFAQLEKQ